MFSLRRLTVLLTVLAVMALTLVACAAEEEEEPADTTDTTAATTDTSDEDAMEEDAMETDEDEAMATDDMDDEAMDDGEEMAEEMDDTEMAEPEALSPTVSRITPPIGDPIAGGQYRAPGLDTRNFDPDSPGSSTYPSSVSHDSLTHWFRDDPLEVSNLLPLPELATSWVFEDDVTLTFTLRQGVKFHDVEPVSGREMVASDVVFSFNRHLSPDSPRSGTLGPISEVTALDDYTVQMKFSEPFAPFMTIISKPVYRVDAPEVLEDFGSFESHAAQIGTGPWMAGWYEQGVKMVWNKNHDYFRGENGVTDQALPYVDQIEIVITEDDAAKMAMYRSGNLDAGPALYYWGFWSALPDHLVALKDRPDLTAHYVVAGGGPYTNYIYAGKQDREPWNNEKLRHAVALINDISCEAWCLITGGIQPSRDFAHDNPWFVPTEQLTELGQKFYKNFPEPTFDFDEAKRLLSEAMVELGMNPDEPFKTTLISWNLEKALQDAAERTASDWERYLGMDVELIILNNEEWSEQIVTGSFDTEAILGYNSGWLDPDDLFYNRYYSESTTNRLNVNDPQLDEWILAGRTELDPQKRRAIYDQMQIYLAEKQYTWIVPNWTNNSLFPEWVQSPGPHLQSNPGDMVLQMWMSEDAPSRERIATQ